MLTFLTCYSVCEGYASSRAVWHAGLSVSAAPFVGQSCQMPFSVWGIFDTLFNVPGFKIELSRRITLLFEHEGLE